LAINDAYAHVEADLQILKDVIAATRSSISDAMSFTRAQESSTTTELLERVRPVFPFPPGLVPAVLDRPQNSSGSLKLVKIGDTRWNSKFYATRRVHWLRAYVTSFLTAHDLSLAARFEETFTILQFCAVVLAPFETLTLMVQSDRSDTLSRSTVALKELIQRLRPIVEWTKDCRQMPLRAQAFVKTLYDRLVYHFKDTILLDGSFELGLQNDVALKAVFLNPRLKRMDSFLTPSKRYHDQSAKQHTIDQIREVVDELRRCQLSMQAPLSVVDESAMDLDEPVQPRTSSAAHSWFDFDSIGTALLNSHLRVNEGTLDIDSLSLSLSLSFFLSVSLSLSYHSWRSYLVHFSDSVHRRSVCSRAWCG
jgi:hypothetical protein